MKQRPRVKFFHKDDLDYNAYGKYSDDSGDEIDLPIRSSHKPQQFVEADIQDGDTLQAIALRFNCSIAALKIANNIHKENEIYARRKLKIPIKAFSLLTETLPAVHTSGSNSPTKVKDILQEDSGIIPPSLDINLQQKLIVASVNSAEVRSPARDNKSQETLFESIPSTSGQFLNGVHNFTDDSVNGSESLPLLIESVHHDPSVEDIVLKEFTSKGDDFGIKWIHLLLLMLLLCVVIPIYVFYLAEHQKNHHHT
ncbi:lysM and putative peptidoglycan-binding domain-containing protein 3 [Arctopsyche grandis]|uniref:lysM and putative peptidoglycan-binding domain-containing protein 3 n=1 Tax=Arctopsyche grandis TaxID=121162 RepID=UPI00406D7A86